MKQLSGGNIIEAIHEISVLLPMLAPLAPYLYAFRSQAPDRRVARAKSARALTGAQPPRARRIASARGSPTRSRT